MLIVEEPELRARRLLSIVIPVYYNAESLPELFRELQQLEERLDALGVAVELIFVNDGSGDASLTVLLDIKRARPATKVVSLARNFGAVQASRCGFTYVRGDSFIMLAADLQDPPEQVIPMVECWLGGDKFVVSARATRADPFLTRLSASAYYQILEWFVLPGYPRGGFDLMLMDRVMLPYMLAAAKNTNPNVYAYWLGFRPTVLHYDRRERRHGKSRWTFSKKLKFFLDTVCGFTVFPIRFMSLLGVIAAVLGVLYGIDIMIAAFFGRVPVQGFATITALISFFSGLILVMLGTLGEYLWRVFDAVTEKPESVVDEAWI